MKDFLKKLRTSTEQLIAEGLTIAAITLCKNGTAQLMWLPDFNDYKVSEVVVVEIAIEQLYIAAREIANIYKKIGCEQETPDIIVRLEKERRAKEGELMLRQVFSDN